MKNNDTCSNTTVCDPRQETSPMCLIKANGNCTGNESKCVKMASCQSGKCTCNSTWSVAGNSICLSKSGGECTTNGTCVSDAMCVDKKCKCNYNVASDSMCTSGAAVLVHPFILIMVIALGAAKLQSISDTA